MPPSLPADQASHLCYVDCTIKGYKRKPSSSGFLYFNTRDQPITNRAALKRIASLVIPPAWKDVWICANPKGHIQATGIDQKGRKQYRYHARWKQWRQSQKFELLRPFGQRLERLRQRVAKDLRKSEWDLDKICALAIEIIDQTSIRPGSPAYQLQNGSYGLTTLYKRHLQERAGNKVFFRFTGKKGIRQEKQIKGKKLIQLLKKVQDIPGQRLFQYVDDQGVKHRLDSGQLNAYLQRTMGLPVSCKTFRTWNASMAALNYFITHYPEETKTRAEQVKRSIDYVAAVLGNTPAVAKQHYVLPQLLDAFEKGDMDRWLKNMQNAPASQHHASAQKYLLKVLAT
ncbi:MAG TPA: DNA topoisomerase IB [Candidatus Sphingobacterium stercorigallinarum]|nr:DNA topoisomerase IB [Candidatus Sphingobacterium stercorigallinarum]